MFLVAGLDDGAPDLATADERHNEDISDLCTFIQRDFFLVKEGAKGECGYYLSDGRDERGKSTSSYAKV